MSGEGDQDGCDPNSIQHEILQVRSVVARGHQGCHCFLLIIHMKEKGPFA